MPGGAEIGRLTEEAIAQFNAGRPGGERAGLVGDPQPSIHATRGPRRQRQTAATGPHHPGLIGLEVETVVDQPEAVPGETLKMRHTAVMRSTSPCSLDRGALPQHPAPAHARSSTCAPNQPVVRDDTQILPATTPPSQPYWLRKAGTAGLFHVDDPSLIGRPENPAAFPIEYVFEIGGQTLVISGEPMQAANPVNAAMRRRLDVIPPVSLRFVPSVQLFAPGAERPVTVELTAARASVAGTVQLEAPTGWRIATASEPFHLRPGRTARHIHFHVSPHQLNPPRQLSRRSVEVNGARFNTQRIEFRYDHIPVQLLQPVARLKAVSLDLAIRGHNIGYLPGAGDEMAGSLESMGYTVTQLTGADLIPAKLRSLDAIVIGIRAFNTRKDLADHVPALFEYVEAGGNVIAQYNGSDRPERKLAGALPASHFARPSHGRASARDVPRTRCIRC